MKSPISPSYYSGKEEKRIIRHSRTETCGTSDPNLMSWVVQVNESLERMPSDEQHYWEKRSIYRVPARIADLNRKAYWPQTVSFGPYHHGKVHLRPMEDHKRRALLHFLRRSRKPIEQFLESLSEEVAQEIEDSYDSLDLKWKKGGGKGEVSPFLELMITDGCFMLEILRTRTNKVHDYASNDPIFGDVGGLYICPYFERDMLMLENQLPMLVLDRLVAIESDGQKGEEYILRLILKFFSSPCTAIERMGKCSHVLDVYRKSILLPENPGEVEPEAGELIIRSATEDGSEAEELLIRSATEDGSEAGELSSRSTTEDRSEAGEPIIRSATELKEAGIKLEKIKTGLKGISFAGGVLRLPFVVVDDVTESKFLNLMTFERFHHGAGSEVTAYLFFMDDIINTEQDIALLNSCGIIKNDLGSDKEVAKLFNSLNKDMMIYKENNLVTVRKEVDKYCNKPWNWWRANLIQTYFRSPWSILSLLAAIFLFTLAIIQTIYTVSPAG